MKSLWHRDIFQNNSFLGVCLFTLEINGQMSLACVVTLPDFHSFSFVKHVRDTWREKTAIDIDWSAEALSLADDVWGEEKRSSTSRKITPPSRDTSLALSLCLCEDPSPSLHPLLYTSQCILSDTFHWALSLDVYWSLYFYFSPSWSEVIDPL